jgi:hypothetical protein
MVERALPVDGNRKIMSLAIRVLDRHVKNVGSE